MKKLPKLRCPVCGKLSFFPNFVGYHKIEAYVLKIKGLGRGRGFQNTYEKQIPDNLIQFWISRLEDVIKYLKKLRQYKIELEVPTSIRRTDLQLEKPCSSVLETYASQKMELRSELIPIATLSVPRCSLIICTNKEKK